MRHPSQSPEPNGERHAVGATAGPIGFLPAWTAMLSGEAPALPTRPGRKPRVPLTQVLSALTFHVMKAKGTLGEHFVELFDTRLADSSLADRRARLPWAIFAELMQRMLRPRATAEGEPDAFWRGWRLLAIDGTQFSVTNAPAIKRRPIKARTRRGRAAFAKLPTAVLLEVGLHNPLAAAVGEPGTAESALARTLLPAIPEQGLVLADRLYGCGAFAAALHAACARRGSHFLVRVQTAVKGRVVEALADGSRVLVVPVKPPYRPTPDARTLTVREIEVRVARAGRRGTTLRLWTSLMDPNTAPALDLGRLYAQRWEQELYFREVKHDLRRTDLLQSHTVETAAQEVAAIVLASALLAVERTRAADGTIPVLRVSFAKMLPIVEGMWFALDIAGPVLTEDQKHFILTEMYKRMRRHITPKRRARSCPRTVRQPVTGWPRLLKNTSVDGAFEFTVL